MAEFDGKRSKRSAFPMGREEFHVEMDIEGKLSTETIHRRLTNFMNSRADWKLKGLIVEGNY
jgi:hypothetical protein